MQHYAAVLRANRTVRLCRVSRVDGLRPATPVSSDRRVLRFEASYESSVAEAFGNLPSSPAYLSPAFLKAEPSSMNFRC